MKKTLTSLLLMLLLSPVSWAAPVKLSTASQTAKKFLQQYGKQLKGTNAVYAPRMLQLLIMCSMLKMAKDL